MTLEVLGGRGVGVGMMVVVVVVLLRAVGHIGSMVACEVLTA